MIVGEAPGRTEDKHGRPFIGASGKYLDELLRDTPLNRSDAYVTNVVHCWPPYSGKQSKPSAKAIKACRRFLEREIAAVNPEVIVTLGATPLSWFFPGESIKAVHGQRLDWHDGVSRTRNIRNGDAYDVRIDRRSPYGNPFVIGKDGTREQVIAKYEAWLPGELKERARRELRGKTLGCWCAPEPCHGDVLNRVANSRTVIPQYHPAASMHNPRLRPVIEADFRSIGAKLGRGEAKIEWRIASIEEAERMIDNVGRDGLLRQYGGKDRASQTEQPVSQSPASGEHLAFDFETTDLRPWLARVVGFSLATGPLGGVYVRLEPDDERRSLRRLRDRLAAAAHRGVRIVAHNAGFELAILAARLGASDAGAELDLDDTMILARLAGKESIGLKPLALSELGLRMSSFTDVVTGDITDADEEQLAEYAVHDAVATYRLWPVLWGLLNARERRLYMATERPLVPAVVSMSANGILTDSDALDVAERESERNAAKLHAQILELAAPLMHVEWEPMPTVRDPDRQRPVFYAGSRRVGPPASMSYPKSLEWTLNPGAPDQVQALLGVQSSDEASLQRLNSPLAEAIVEYRHEKKFTSSYVTPVRRSLPRLRGSFNQVGTDTGRVSASGYKLLSGDTVGINLQTPPKRIKAALIADEGRTLVEIDYSQIELRVLAHLTQDAGLLDAYRAGRDIHNETMERAGLHDRRIAKILNFGTSYEPDDDSAAYVARTAARKEGIHLTKNESLSFVRAHRRAYPGVLDYYASIDNQIQQRGFVETILGRKFRVRYIPGTDNDTRKANWELLRKAINHPVQGTAADIIKTAWVAMWQDPARPQSVRWLDMIHDSFLLDCADDDVESTIYWAVPLMENAIALDVPVICDVKSGKRWSELQEYDYRR